MEKIITGIEFAILVAIIIGIIILLNIMEARRRINAANSQPQDEAQAKEDEKQRRRMVHEADSYNEATSMKPFCGGSDAHTRSRAAVARAQEAARNSTIRHFAEDLSKRDDEMAKVINGIQRRVLDEQRAALDRITGKKP